MPSIIAKTRVEHEDLLWDREMHLRHLVAQYLGIGVDGTDFDVVTYRQSVRTGNKPWLCIEIELSEGPLGHIQLPRDLFRIYELAHGIKTSLKKRPEFKEKEDFHVYIKPALCGVYITSGDSKETVDEERTTIKKYLNNRVQPQARRQTN